MLIHKYDNDVKVRTAVSINVMDWHGNEPAGNGQRHGPGTIYVWYPS